MEEKLKLTLNRIPWYLVLKAALFGAGWLVLPYWLFLVLAAYLYLIPLFQAATVGLPFLFTLFLAAVIPGSLWAALFLSLLFFFIAGIKDLVFVDRLTAFSLLVLVLLFLLFFYSYSVFDAGLALVSAGWFLGAVLVSFFLFRSFVIYGFKDRATKRFRNTALALLSFFVLEIALALLVIPMNFLYSTALLFLAAALLFEMSVDYWGNSLRPRRILGYFSLFFVLMVILISLADFTV